MIRKRLRGLLAAAAVVAVAGTAAVIAANVASAATTGVYTVYVHGARAGVLTFTGSTVTFNDIQGSAGGDTDPLTFPNGAQWRTKSGGWQRCHDAGWCGVAAFSNGQYVGDNFLSLQDSSPAVAGQEATFDDYARKLCPVAASSGFQSRVLAADSSQAPTRVNDSFPDGGNGKWSNLAEPAPCLSFFLNRLAEPARSNYSATLKTLHDKLDGCAGSGFKMGYRDHPGKLEFYPDWDFRNALSTKQAGANWTGCLASPPQTRNPTIDEFKAGASWIEPAPHSLIESILFTADDPTTPYPEYLDPKRPLYDRWVMSRAAERQSASDTRWLRIGEAQRQSIRTALGVNLEAPGAAAGGIIGSTGGSYTTASAGPTVADLSGWVG